MSHWSNAINKFEKDGLTYEKMRRVFQAGWRSYRETARYSFAMQVYLLNRRFQQHQEIIWRGRPAVQLRYAQ